MKEVLVEKMEMVFEFQQAGTEPWQRVAVVCAFAPAAPVLVREAQVVHYDCELQDPIPPGAELRAAVEIRLFGSDQAFRMDVKK